MTGREKVWQEISHALFYDYTNKVRHNAGGYALAQLLNSTIELREFTSGTSDALRRQYLHRYGDILSISKAEFIDQLEMGTNRANSMEAYLAARGLRFRGRDETLVERLEDLYGEFYWISPSVVLRHILVFELRTFEDGRTRWVDLNYHMWAAESAGWTGLGQYPLRQALLGSTFSAEDHRRISECLTSLGLMC